MKILALHGFTGSGADFKPLSEALSVEVVAPDLLGHGEAEAPTSVAPYRIDRVATRVAEAHDGGPVVLLGYSMGGRVAQRLCPMLGDALKGLILVSTSPGILDPVDRTERIAEDAALAGRIEENGIAWFCAHWADQPIIRSQARIPADILESMEARRISNRPHGLANSLRGMGAGAVNPVWDALAEITVPTLILSGEEDLRYAAIGERMAAHIPEAEHTTVPSVGHCVHLEAVQAVADIIDRFVAGFSE
jgi:2-succinyl-6-hydroxy-2,4-cyclohexadiene-1-carboxylate synthase